jgi:hypothetical protein
MDLKTDAPLASHVSALKERAYLFMDDAQKSALLEQARLGIRVVSRSLKDLDNDNWLEAGYATGEPTTWRVLSEDGGINVGGELSARNGVEKLVSILPDKLISATLNTLRMLRDYKLHDQEPYQVMILSIPSVLLEAFWLTSANGKDLIVPILSASKELHVGEVYEKDAFTSVVRVIAERFRKQVELLKEPPPPPLNYV